MLSILLGIEFEILVVEQQLLLSQASNNPTRKLYKWSKEAKEANNNQSGIISDPFAFPHLYSLIFKLKKQQPSVSISMFIFFVLQII